jgi:hypothetical protein
LDRKRRKFLKSESENRNNARSSKGRDARDAALGVFVKAKLAETRATDAAKISRLRALRLAKEAADKKAAISAPSAKALRSRS